MCFLPGEAGKPSDAVPNGGAGGKTRYSMHQHATVRIWGRYKALYIFQHGVYNVYY